MKNLSKFCTCGDLECPLHPTNHELGCAPCISKNLKQGEIPNCFFNKVEKTHESDGYTFKDFADAVMKQNQ